MAPIQTTPTTAPTTCDPVTAPRVAFAIAVVGRCFHVVIEEHRTSFYCDLSEPVIYAPPDASLCELGHLGEEIARRLEGA